MYWHTLALNPDLFYTKVVASDTGLDDSYKPLNKVQHTHFGELIFFKTLVHYFPLRLLLHTIRNIKNFDVIHLTSLFYPPSLIIVIINYFFYEKKIVWSIRGSLEQKAIEFRSSLFKRLFLFVIKRFQNSNIWYHSTSKNESNQISKILSPQERIIQLPNYFNLELDVTKTERSKYFLFVGRINPIKNIDVFFRAAHKSQLFQSNNYSIKIVGDTNTAYAAELKLLANKLGLKVEFLGRVDGERKHNILNKAFFLFLISKSENFGNVVFESLSNKTPVIASLGTPWEDLVHTHSGFWVESKADRLVETIDKTIQLNDLDYFSMCNNAFDLAKKFSTSEIFNWEDFYTKILK